MDDSLLVSALNVLVAFLGVLFVVMTLFEYKSLVRLRKDFAILKSEMKDEIYRTQKAMQRVIASYGMTDPHQRASLLQEAVDIDPLVFNGYNALGYAYMEMRQMHHAIDSFSEAVRLRPKDKAGYFDLAMAYMEMDERELCLKYLRKAVRVDATSKEDLRSSPQFAAMAGDAQFMQLLQ